MGNDNKENKEMRKPEDCAHWNLYLEGKDTWNMWASNNLSPNAKEQLQHKIKMVPPKPETIIDFSNVRFDDFVDFSGFNFPSQVLFDKSTFIKNVNFKGAIFNCLVDFEETKFIEETPFIRTIFSEEAYFIGAKFTERVDFEEAEFRGGADFSGTIFGKEAYFLKAIFAFGASFIKAIFSGHGYFVRATFSSWADFKEAIFKEKASFINCDFNSITNFEKSTFWIAPEFHEATLHQDTNFNKINPMHKDEDHVRSAAAWRTLKLAMNEKHHYQQELIFFGFEMDANYRSDKIRCQSFTTPLSVSVRTFSTFCYKLLADYGRSYVRPLISLVVIGFIFSGLYLCVTSDWSDAIKLSITCTFPFIGLTKSVFQGIITNHDTLLLFIVAIHTVFSFVLLFLTGLGFRNQFAIK